MYAHDLEKRQQLFRSGQLRKLSAAQTYSEKDPRKPSGPTARPVVGPVGDGMGSGVPGEFGAVEQQSDKYPSIPRPFEHGASTSSGSGIGAAPPSYNESEAQHVIAGSASAAGGLGLAPGHAAEAAESGVKRRVPPPPVPPRKS